MVYVDGFVLSVPKKNLKKYQKLAQEAGKIYIDLGAWKFVESVGKDLKGFPGSMTFPQIAKTKASEVVLFSFIVFKDKKHRDQVTKKFMADKRIQDMTIEAMPHDVKRMAVGGFESIVDLE
jgi:uncharacterized protein YbaA (DUF1428 family)